MKKLLLTLTILAIIFAARAQPYGNEWINTSQNYYKIKVWRDGIHRVPYSALFAAFQNANVNINSIRPFRLALYHNGVSVPVYVSSVTDTLKPNDYIEFYGERNKGYIDSLLYRSADEQMNPDYSLFTDTAIYFLTQNPFPNSQRMIVTTYDTINHPPREEFFMHKTLALSGRTYFEGKYYSEGNDELYKSTYDAGEGYADANFFGNSAPRTYTVAAPSLYGAGQNSILRINYASNSAYERHNVVIRLNNNQIYQRADTGFAFHRLELSIPTSQLVSGNNSLVFSDNGNGISQRQNKVGFIELEYQRQFDFGAASASFYFELNSSSAGNKYFEITAFNSQATQPLLYDLTNNRIYRSVSPAGSIPLRFKIPVQAGKTRLFLRADVAATYTEVSSITQAVFQTFSASDYYIISHRNLRADTSGFDPVADYLNFRSTKYNNPQAADIDVLYDQFGYGIRKSPLAIRNFIAYAKNSFGLKYVFLVGKGRESRIMRPVSNTPGAYNQCLIPTFGYPGSDNLLAASRSSDTMQVAIGRLPATNRTQVSNYLAKMDLYEREQNTYTNTQEIPPKDWQKKILHFSGGTSSFEQNTFKMYLYRYGQIATDTLWGTDTTSFSKTSGAPIDHTLADVIKSKINQGVSWITFFGHSATGAFDFSIDEPENYNNSPKFPIILSNGCFSGFIHDATQGYSERFVMARDKAAIAFMATSSLSVASGLDVFSTQMYNNVCRKNYFQPLGKSFRQAYNDVNNCCSSSDRNMGVAYEMTLNGDPGLLVNQYPKPDYAIDSTSVFFTPTTITAGLDSFSVNVVVTNLGRAIKDSITVELRRIYSEPANPQSTNTLTFREQIAAPYYKDTVVFTMSTQISNLGYGQNYFDVLVDADHHIDEMAECNNGVDAAQCGSGAHTAEIFILNDDIIPIYPYEFAIVPDSSVTLKSSTVNPFAPYRAYRIQLDTSELFLNPLKDTVLFHSGGVVPWTIKFPVRLNGDVKDSTVYYWRIAKDTSVLSAVKWHYSSFIYLQGEFPGWNQSHYYQWQKDNFLYVYLDSNDRVFKFPQTGNAIKVLTGWADAVGGNLDYSTLGWDFNNVNMYRYRMGSCGFANSNTTGNAASGGLTFAVINNITGEPWESWNVVPSTRDNWGDKFGNYHCSDKDYRQNGFDFRLSGTHPDIGTSWAQLIQNFVDSIPNGYYILLYSTNRPAYSLMNTSLVQTLQSIGLQQADSFKNGQINGPFVFFTQKGNSSPIYFDYRSGYSVPIEANINFTGTWNRGQFTSPKIGPAFEWGSVHWRHEALENPTSDRDTIDIIGVKSNGIDTVLISTTNLNNIITNQISAVEYPYLKLRLRTRDDALRTPTQALYWRVLFKKPPEAAINPSLWFKVSDSLLNIGETFHVEIALQNVTDVPMDSMLTKYTVRDATGAPAISYIRYDSLRALDTLHLIFNKPLNGSNFIGSNNRIIIEANPDDDQLEQYHFNNFAEINFSARGDKVNPLLDVTFDNQHIMDGDIVSAKPNILITLKDENKYLPLNNPEFIEVFLKAPDQTVAQKIDYGNPAITFYPPDANNLQNGNNKAHVEFKPTLAVDGKYELLVRDRDSSGNTSNTTYVSEGNIFYDYKISFTVINKPMITNVLNYPNPFTTSTRFIFTITGSEIPDIFKIQIMTIKGTVVREITKEELGDIHIGRNISQYAWDGRDQYGDLLANGVYFYNVVARLDDKRMDRLSQSYDKYFKKGFGKLVIVR